MFSKIYVKKNEIALEFKKGEFQTILTAGNHFSFGKKEYELIDLSNRVEVNADLMEYLLRYRQEIVEKQITLLETKSNEVAIFYKDGLPCELILPNSKKYYWTDSLTEQFAIKTLNEFDALSQEDSKEIFTAVNHPTFVIDSSYFYLAHIQKGYLGLLYLHNKLVDIIAEDQYYITPSNSEKMRLEIINIETFPMTFALSAELENAFPDKIHEFAISLRTNQDEIGLHYEDGNLLGIYPPNTHKLFLKNIKKQQIKIVSFNEDRVVDPALIKDIELSQSKNIAVMNFQKVFITRPVAHSKILLEINGKTAHVLDAGTYGFWNFDNKVQQHIIDMRVQSMEVTGQEILTKDKVNLRINLVANWQYVDALKAVESLENPQEFLYKELQFGLREAIGTRTLDELLENKTVIDEFVQNYIKDRVPQYGFNIVSVGVKDIILPGEMKEILARVVEAEKSAQANVIKRREETSATRSLLNTAKVMENNPVALRLKEMETLEKISEKIEHLNVVGGLDQVLHGLVNIQPPKKKGILKD
ncbi:slipin family protein [Ignatzschineria sp. LJL83]